MARQHEDWALGYVDEVWWSLMAQPKMHAWSFNGPLRLEQKQKQKGERQALACYGVLFDKGDEGASKQMLLRFVERRPVSAVTIAFLEWVLEALALEGKRVWVLVWDNASWHKSQKVRRWISAHNRKVKREGGVRILECRLPVQSPWLNPIEPTWLHGKRAIVEPSRKLSIDEIMERVCAHYGCELWEPIPQDVL